MWEEPAGFTASRILDEGYGEMTDLRPVDAGPGFNNVNNGWPRLRATLDGPGCPTLDGPGCPARLPGWPRLPAFINPKVMPGGVGLWGTDKLEVWHHGALSVEQD